MGAGDAGPIHVHGLGVDPQDGALMIATHTGLFRAPPGERTARRVGGLYQDTMGFTIIGAGRFLGSGHPGAADTDEPPFLGLIESRDGGRSWRSVSLRGRVDFHVLEASGRRVVGFGSDFGSRRPVLLVSSDAGRTWRERRPPEPLVDLALMPGNPDRWVASGERRLYASLDAGRSWRRLDAPPGLLAWTERDGLSLLTAGGDALRSTDGGASWKPAGRAPGRPAALGAGPGALYLALHDGTIMRSADAGRTWTLRSRP